MGNNEFVAATVNVFVVIALRPLPVLMAIETAVAERVVPISRVYHFAKPVSAVMAVLLAVPAVRYGVPVEPQ